MKRQAAILLMAAIAFTIEDAHAFGKKYSYTTEVTGVTESQAAPAPVSNGTSVMVRGRVAELLYRMINRDKRELSGSDALALTKNAASAHWTVSGKQVTCSKIATKDQKKADYACSFEIGSNGAVVAGTEPFNPKLFNLARTNVPDRFFPKTAAGRGLASNASAYEAYETSAAYVMYDKGESAKDAKDVMVVFKADVAKKLMGVIANGPGVNAFTKNGNKGWKGRDLACVEAVGSTQERCALVISLEDGSVSKRKNPLF